MRGEQLLERRQSDSRLVAESRDGAIARIEPWVRPRRRGQRIVAQVVVADPPAQPLIRGGAAGALDPGVLIERHRLRRQLPADPVGLLGHHHAQAGARGRKGRGASAEAAADDDQIRRELPGRPAIAALSGVERRLEQRSGSRENHSLQECAAIEAR